MGWNKNGDDKSFRFLRSFPYSRITLLPISVAIIRAIDSTIRGPYAAVLSIIGIVLNIFSVYVFKKGEKGPSPAIHLYLIVLTLWHTGVLVFILWTSVPYTIYGNPLPSEDYKHIYAFVRFANSICTFASNWVIIALTVDRFLALCHPLKHRAFCTRRCRREENDYVFELKGEWIGAEFELRWEEARRSRPVTPIEQGATKPKRQRIEPELEELPVDGDLAASVGRYALYYVRDDNYKRCAIPLTTRLAATFRHGENKSIKKGDEIVIRSWFDEKFEVSTRAVKFIEELDTIILQSDGADLCDKDLVFDSIEPRKGMHYLLMGYSIVHGKTNHQSLSTGIIANDITRRMRYTGSSGSFKGDSGGSCWNEDGRLMGMQVEVEKVPHTKDDKGRPASPASGGRCCIVAIRDVLGHIQDLLPPDSDVDWNE